MMTQTLNGERTIDLRGAIPQRRYDLVFDGFADLAPGASYLLISDQNPKPLHYQFAAEYSGEYTWDYLENGPDVWRVRIGRRVRSGGRL